MIRIEYDNDKVKTYVELMPALQFYYKVFSKKPTVYVGCLGKVDQEWINRYLTPAEAIKRQKSLLKLRTNVFARHHTECLINCTFQDKNLAIALADLLRGYGYEVSTKKVK